MAISVLESVVASVPSRPASWWAANHRLQTPSAIVAHLFLQEFSDFALLYPWIIVSGSDRP
jgi:hypothetical protein